MCCAVLYAPAAEKSNYTFWVVFSLKDIRHFFILFFFLTSSSFFYFVDVIVVFFCVSYVCVCVVISLYCIFRQLYRERGYLPAFVIGNVSMIYQENGLKISSYLIHHASRLFGILSNDDNCLKISI